MNKPELRKQIVTARPDAPTRKRLSQRILNRFQETTLFQNATAIGLYIPLPDEVDVAPLFHCAGKKIFIPAFDPSSGGYRLAAYTSDLQKGKFGIPEPVNPRFAQRDDLDVILVPGIAFDPSGGRLGRGGGFYDRLLPLYTAQRIGICFGFQCVETVPAEPHDIPMQALLNESGLIEH